MEGWARESLAPDEHSEDMLRNVQLAPEGIVWDVSRDRNLKNCLPPTANRPQP